MNGLIALTSAKHSPGVTTAALAFGIAAGPHPLSLIVEADPAGGDLAARCELPVEPGLGSLAASGRHGAPVDLAAHIQSLPAGPFGLLAPPSPSLATGGLDALGSRLADAVRGWEGTVVLDCGRWRPDGPGAALAASADVFLVVVRPSVEGIEHVRARLDEFRAVRPPRLAVVLVGDRPYDPGELATVLDIPVAGALPLDPRGVRALEHRVIGAETRRSRVVRAARSALDAIGSWPAARVGVRP